MHHHSSTGITELARINSPELSAFSDCAWIPTLLPPWTLGNLSQASSACFVASDGQSLRIFQAVIDAQLLLAHMYADMRKPVVRNSHKIYITFENHFFSFFIIENTDIRNSQVRRI